MIAVIYFPGNNCEEETKRAIKAAGMDCDILRWNTKEDISKYDGFALVGGWSYEDRVRAGAIPARDPLMIKIKQQAELKKPIIGICNGAQVLIESGLIPDTKDKKEIEMALAPNINPFVQGFYCTWVNIKVENKNAFTKTLQKNEIIKLPIAHAEGRFTSNDPAMLKELTSYKQIAFRYCGKDGNTKEEFPINPNSSLSNIAGLTNKAGNVLAIMPHPERASFYKNQPNFEHKTFEDNMEKAKAFKIFQSMKFYIEEEIR